MVIKRVVILPTRGSAAFDRMAMPDGSDALVVNRRVHEGALDAADRTLGRIIRKIRQDVRGAGKAA